jgi:hypothetical protein
MTAQYFLAASALAIAILVPMGAPVAALVGGIALATVINVTLNKLNAVPSRKSKHSKKPNS